MIVSIWIVSVGLGAFGIFLLIHGIKQIQKAVGGPVLLKLPLTQKSGQFVLTHTGDYAIWQSGRTLQRVPEKMMMPAISALQTGETIVVHPTFSAMRVNNGWEGRIQLFTFQAKAGQYELELTMDASTIYPKSTYFLEIRAREPGHVLVLGILLLILGAVCLLAGMVLPFI